MLTMAQAPSAIACPNRLRSTILGKPLAEQGNSWIGRVLGGRYKILDLIGEGGMGIVYRAQQTSVDRDVAIKMMHARAAQDPRWVERFHREAKACSLLTHPNTVRLYDFGQTTLGNLYMVMELLDGQPLSEVIRQQAPMPAARVLRILMQCAASLSEAHDAGIIHRDIKPDNIFVLNLAGTTDFIKLLDFSVAKMSMSSMTAAGMIFGTPQYMSPEQAAGHSVDARSDLYSLGVVAYEMLTRTLPFNHTDPMIILQMHQAHEIPPLPPEVPRPVARLVMSCLSKAPENRPPSALAVLEASRVWLSELDPSVNIATDPVLKNTVISPNPPSGMRSSRTMIGTAPSLLTPKRKRPPISQGITQIITPKPMPKVEARPFTRPPGVPMSTPDRGIKELPANHELQSTHIVAQPTTPVATPVVASGVSGTAQTVPTPVLTTTATTPAPAPTQTTTATIPAPTAQPPRSHQATERPPAQVLPRSMSEDMPAQTESSTASFLLLCLLVGASFGLGSYYLVATFR